MAALLTIICFLFMGMETLVGMVANGSIILINFLEWFRRRKLSPTDLILTCLGSSRLLLQALLFVDSTLFIWFHGTLKKVLFTIMGMWIFMNAVNLWLAACLSVFYLAKIAVFSHPVFLQVKQRFSRLLPGLLLGSVIFSAAMAIIVTPIWMKGLSSCISLTSSSSNRSNAQTNMPYLCSRNLALTVAVDFLPFVVFLLSSIFLIGSLWKHVRRVQCNGTGTKDLNTQVHWSAIKALASFAVLHLISYSAFTSLTVVVLNNRHTWTIVLYNLSAGYPSGHAIILILMNPKLKQAWVRMLRHLKCRSRCKI